MVEFKLHWRVGRDAGYFILDTYWDEDYLQTVCERFAGHITRIERIN